MVLRDEFLGLDCSLLDVRKTNLYITTVPLQI